MQPPVQDDNISFAEGRQSQPLPFPHGDTGAEIIAAPLRQFAPPRRTDHTYKDYANQIPSPHECPITKKSGSNFPAKLHRMISDSANSQAIAWQSHGRAWKILDKRLLVDVVIPKYFLQTKYESFTRQLSGWGFKRLHRTGPDYQCYYHECFLRGLPHLTRLMKRAEPYQGKLLPNVEAEPKFFEMPLPSSTGYTQPQSPVNFRAEAVAAGTHLFQPDAHELSWDANNTPSNMLPGPYGHYHYHGHNPPAPPSSLPAYPPRDMYTSPYHRSRPEQQFLLNPTHRPQDHEYVGAPYHGESSAWAAAARHPSQSFPAYTQAQPTYFANPSIGPHVVAHQHTPQNSYNSYLNWEHPQSSIVYASYNHNIHHEDGHRRPIPGYHSTYSPNPSGIDPHTIVHQHPPPNNHDSYLNWHHPEQFPHSNNANTGYIHPESLDQRPHSSY